MHGIILEFSEIFEAERWHEDSRFFSPMIEHNGEYIFIDDLVKVKDQTYGDCIAKVSKFTEVVCPYILSQDTITSLVFKCMQIQIHFTQKHSRGIIISANMLLCSAANLLGLSLPDACKWILVSEAPKEYSICEMIGKGSTPVGKHAVYKMVEGEFMEINSKVNEINV